MTRWIPVRASRLHQRQLACGDTTIRQATLFPFFDASGTVKNLLIVDANSTDLRAFPWESTRLSVPLWGPIRVDGQVTDINQDIIEQLVELWHYDPWWLLRDERFASYPELATLRLTNCVASFHHQPTEILFTRRLSKIGRLMFRSSSQENGNKRFRPDMLPTSKPVRPPAAEAQIGGWRLEPFWQGQ